jgi:competence protein ComEC
MTIRLTGTISSWFAVLSAAVFVFNPAASNRALASDRGSTAGTLEIYFVDVEGGQSTLIVTPTHQSLLIDAGFPGDGTFDSKPGDPTQARDANRVLAAVRDAGLKQIDYLLVTHFHADHDGGIPELSRLIPIRTFVDHGDPNPDADKDVPGTLDAFRAYETVRGKGRHLEPNPGDRLPLADVDAVIVSTKTLTLARPMAGAGGMNDLCKASPIPARDPYENPRSTGILLKFGKFRFLDVGDLTGSPLFDLACPRDKIGPVDVYLVAHHGGPDAADPATFAAFRPRVAIMNNGLKKGGARETYTTLHQVAGLEGVWQLHHSEAASDQNFSADRIANLDESTAYWIKLTAHADGSFQVLNPRTSTAKAYPPR